MVQRHASVEAVCREEADVAVAERGAEVELLEGDDGGFRHSGCATGFVSRV